MFKKQTSKFFVALGHFFFHYRNSLFPIYVLAMLTFTRPNPALDMGGPLVVLWKGLALLLICLGSAIRLGTIGFRYIERGGKNRHVFASRLVTEGVYQHVRNPMYIGNVLIVVGLSLLTTSLFATIISVPLFVFIYRCIVAAEEQFLREKFGPEFESYCQHVNRFWPNLKGLGATLAPIPFEWKRTLRKDYGNIAMIILALTVLPLWRRFFEESHHRLMYLFEGHVLHERIETAGWYLAILAIVYLLVWYLKKHGRLTDNHSN